ncbi:MAG: hypothetical protein ACLP1X_07790 [Polyangiaceae bacterium]
MDSSKHAPAGIVALAVGSLMASACSIFTPPTRPFPLETVATAGNGRTGEQVEIARSSGLDADSATMRVRRGIGSDTDVSVEGTAIHVASGNSDPDLRIWSGRAGVKRRVNEWLAFTGGLGAGAFGGDPFAGPDVGGIAAYENPYVVPFAALRGSVSIPLASRPVDFADQGTPRTDWFGQLAVGARFPLGCACQEPRAGELRGSILLGYSRTWYADTKNNGAFDAFAGGGEITF